MKSAADAIEVQCCSSYVRAISYVHFVTFHLCDVSESVDFDLKFRCVKFVVSKVLSSFTEQFSEN